MNHASSLKSGSTQNTEVTRKLKYFLSSTTTEPKMNLIMTITHYPQGMHGIGGKHQELHRQEGSNHCNSTW